MNSFCIQIPLGLISIAGCDSKSRTISVWPFAEAQIKGVKGNIGIQFHRWNTIKIAWNN